MTEAPKHLIDWKSWEDGEIRELLALARRVKRRRWEFQGHMQGRTLVMVFQKTSTRTRVSFEAGMTELGGHAINLDWARVELHPERHPFGNAVSLAQLRIHHGATEEPLGFARHGRGRDGAGDQRVLQPLPPLPDARRHADHRRGPGRPGRRAPDLHRRLQQRGELAGVDLGRARGRAYPGLPVRDETLVDEESRARLLGLGLLTETLDAKAAVADADYVYTDTWIDMEYFNDPAFAEEKERRYALMLPYQLNAELLAGSGARVMHDMPMHLGYEITEDLAESERSIIYDQAENRLDAQKAILLKLV